MSNNFLLQTGGATSEVEVTATWLKPTHTYALNRRFKNPGKLAKSLSWVVSTYL